MWRNRACELAQLFSLTGRSMAQMPQTEGQEGPLFHRVRETWRMLTRAIMT